PRPRRRLRAVPPRRGRTAPERRRAPAAGRAPAARQRAGARGGAGERPGDGLGRGARQPLVARHRAAAAGAAALRGGSGAGHGSRRGAPRRGGGSAVAATPQGASGTSSPVSRSRRNAPLSGTARRNERVVVPISSKVWRPGASAGA